MDLNLIAEVWDVLKFHIEPSEVKVAAENLVDLLINNDYESEDIKEAFSDERSVLTALKNNIEELDQLDDSYDDDLYYNAYDDDDWR
jgi:dsDNA-specific endonuclease/ATPase MutS2